MSLNSDILQIPHKCYSISTLSMRMRPIDIYVIASRCSRSNFSCGKYKTVQSLKLNLLQNIPFVQLYISSSDCKDVGNIPGSNFVKDFSALPPHSLYQ